MVRLTEAQAAKMGHAMSAVRNPLASQVILVLPWPPSSNNLYPTIHVAGAKPRRIKSEAAKAFRRATARSILAQSVPRHAIYGALTIELDFFAPLVTPAYDLDNRVKAVLDALQANGIIENDKDVGVLMLRRRPACSEGGVFVRITNTEPKGNP